MKQAQVLIYKGDREQMGEDAGQRPNGAQVA